MKPLLLFSLLVLHIAIACKTDPSEWSSYTFNVIYQPNNPASVVAKESVKASFCSKFQISPCQVNPSAPANVLHLSSDLAINVPRDQFDQVLPWLQQARLGRLGSGYDLDLLIEPNTGDDCSSSETSDYSLFLGRKYRFNPNKLIKQEQEIHSDADTWFGHRLIKDDDSWVFECSDDCTCPEPHANNTGCASSTIAYHLHLYYIDNNPESVEAKEKFHSTLSSAFGMDPTAVCPDTTGHEQPHPSTCWLTGPEGKENPYPQDHAFSSFVTGTHSLYIRLENATDVISWIMAHRNDEYIGAGGLDFLLHPTFGCNFADHQLWGLHGGWWWANNMPGISSAAGQPPGDPAPSLDPQAVAYPAPPETCSNAPYQQFFMHVLYDSSSPSIVSDKDNYLASLKSNFADAFADGSIRVDDDDPNAFLDPSSPFVTGQLGLSVKASILSPIIDWTISSISDTLDVVYAPDADCPYHQYVSRSFYLGHRWSFNKAAFSSSTSSSASSSSSSSSSSSASSSASSSSVGDATIKIDLSQNVGNRSSWDWILYMPHAPNNAWAAAGTKAFVDSLSTVFNLTQGECASQYPNPEPSYNKLCLMQDLTYAYKNNNDPFAVARNALYVPAAQFTQVFSFAMQYKSAYVNSGGYEVDLQLVPLRGQDLLADYVCAALRAGNTWRNNEKPLH